MIDEPEAGISKAIQCYVKPRSSNIDVSKKGGLPYGQFLIFHTTLLSLCSDPRQDVRSQEIRGCQREFSFRLIEFTRVSPNTIKNYSLTFAAGNYRRTSWP